MSGLPAGPLSAATHVKEMAEKMPNQKMAFVLTGLSVALVGIMVWREMTHALREQMRALEKPEHGHRKGH